jgi:lysophospholipase L1-like esterase
MAMIRVVALGDSTTAGTPGWLSPIEAPPSGRGDETSQYAYWLMRAHRDWDVLNRGVNGERTDQIAARFDRDVLASSPHAVIVIGGVNDVYQGRPASHAIAHLQGMFERGRAAGITLVAGTIVPYNTATPDQNARMSEINSWIAASGVPWADTRAAVADPDNPDRLASSPDGLHPSPDGYRRMADAIAPVLERLIGGAESPALRTPC